MNVNELLKAKNEAKVKAEAILAPAVKDNRDLTADETGRYDACVAEVAKFDNLIAKASQVSGWNTELSQPNGKAIRPTTAAQKEAQEEFRATAEYKSAVLAHARRGASLVDGQILAVLNEGTSSEGGFVVPQEFDKNLVEKLQIFNPMRSLATVITTASDRNIPIEDSIGSASWTDENAAYNESDPSFTRTLLKAYKLTRIVKVSEELLNDSLFDLQPYLVRKFGQTFGIAEEAAFINGAGSTQPTGVISGATLGLTAASQTTVTGDELLGLFHSLKVQYRANAAWVMSDAMALNIRKLKFQIGSDTIGYQWQQSLRDGQPDRLLGKPVYISNGMPTPVLAGSPPSGGATTILFGDFSYYTIADRTPRTFQRLNELYAANGQVGFKMSERTDGALTLAEAVVKLVQHA